MPFERPNGISASPIARHSARIRKPSAAAAEAATTGYCLV
jgi:hypothetical protein